MKAYSQDLRDRIVRTCDEGQLTRRAIARLFLVGESFIRKLMQRRRETGAYAAKPHSGGGQPKLQAPHRQALQAAVQQRPDVTLAELCQHLEQHAHLSVSDCTVSRALQALKLPRKKSRCTPANATASG